MHLQMQRDVWLDNAINLRQYILRYTVGNPTSLRNVAFHWLTSEYMQLASGFMQLAAAEPICGVSTQLQSSGLVAHENSTFRNLALAVSGPFMA